MIYYSLNASKNSPSNMISSGRSGSMGIGSWLKTGSIPKGLLLGCHTFTSETFHLITEFLISGKKVLFR